MWTWGDDDIGFKRARIKDLPFRTLFRVARDYLDKAGCKYARADRLFTILAYRFFEQHSTVPYPDSNGSMQNVNKRHARVLLCFQPLEAVETVPRGTDWMDVGRAVVLIKSEHNATVRSAPVPACLDRIGSIEEAKAWIAHRHNLVCYG
jgi:hypothetical protein